MSARHAFGRGWARAGQPAESVHPTDWVDDMPEVHDCAVDSPQALGWLGVSVGAGLLIVLAVVSAWLWVAP